MVLLILNLVVDVCWYFAVIGSLLHAVPLPVAIALYALPVLYVGNIFFKWKRYTSQFSHQDLFVWQCKILLASAFLSLPFGGLALWQQACVPWIFAFLTLGVLYLRISRLGKTHQNDKRFWIWNGVYVAVAFLSAVIFSSETIVRNLLDGIKYIYFNVIIPIIMPCFSIIYWISSAIVVLVKWVAAWIMRLFPYTPQVEPELSLDGMMNDIELPAGTMTELPLAFKVIGIVVLVVISLLTIWFVYRKLTNSSRLTMPSSVQKIAITSPGRPDSGIPKAKRGEKSIRAYYQKFLKLYMNIGLPLKPSDCSQEVQENAATVWTQEPLTALRKLYIRARYCSRDVSTEEIEAAKNAYRQLKSSRPR